MCIRDSYFGGTKLGVSGLTAAYKEASSAALQNAHVVLKVRTKPYRITFSYAITNDVMRLIREENLTVEDQQFDTSCRITILIMLSRIHEVIERVQRINNVTIEPVE